MDLIMLIHKISNDEIDNYIDDFLKAFLMQNNN
jgi:hypothetical protein